MPGGLQPQLLAVLPFGPFFDHITSHHKTVPDCPLVVPVDTVGTQQVLLARISILSSHFE